MKIFIPEDVLTNDMNNYEMLAYCYLRALTYSKEMEKYYISMNALLYAVYESESVSQDIRKNMYAAVNSLFDRGIIQGHRCGRQAYIVETVHILANSQNHFSVVEFEDIQTIIRSNSKIRVPLVRYYVYLMSTINSHITVKDNAGHAKKYIVGNQTQSYLSELTGLSPATIVRYNKLLENMKVVYIYRANILVLDGNAVKHTSNIYGRYADKEYIIKYGEDVKQQRGAHNCFESQQDKANRGRSLSMKYRWMCQGRQYSKAEKQEIREHIDEYNKKCEKLAETKQNKRYLENIKDVGIFNQNVFQGEE